MKNKCTVCGYPFLESAPWGEDKKCPSYDICPCCGVEFGYEDITSESRKVYFDRWVSEGTIWFDERKKPQKWNLEEQLKNL